ncbi:carbonic anhydrase [Aspergillus clavatus NRRL 1]|uniref:Carbonic anhydrase n=1 Tax=Aspergillus clavatus (strain ATCC 1007 / CBS 513.65 / DSM 816 / NCTC 3887 / NRRL 1 / QM 1276 / 107) TaxID=344612 RepID=A1CI57_ASPCL|nr:carbonic anhydrase family protein [Aspergillus clavatus NRRL 1]EAW10562.1 carbonic anhydrase family protein [Aspergillus clavatus NRRL 1]
MPTAAPSGSLENFAEAHAGANDTPFADKFSILLAKNKDWAAQTYKQHPDLLPQLAVGQHPEILWIGCSDSRCPETTILGLLPGDVFTHRNIANVIHPADLSSGAVIEYAVRHLQVKHIVICGHTKCGGVAAALGNKGLGILDPWLLPLRQLREQHHTELETLPGDEATVKLAELNVREGLKTLKQKSVVLEAIQERGLQVHGMIYDVGSGVLRELDSSEPEDAIKARYASFKTEA